jgi:hypothetical protein
MMLWWAGGLIVTLLLRQRSWIAVTILFGIGAAVFAVSRSADPIRERCDLIQLKIFNDPALRNERQKLAHVTYVFDVTHANAALLKRTMLPPLGSLETRQLLVADGQMILTYETGRVGDIYGASSEIREMCLRERDDGFHLRTVRVSEDGFDIKVGPDSAVRKFAPVVGIDGAVPVTTRGG